MPVFNIIVIRFCLEKYFSRYLQLESRDPMTRSVDGIFRRTFLIGISRCTFLIKDTLQCLRSWNSGATPTTPTDAQTHQEVATHSGGSKLC